MAEQVETAADGADPAMAGRRGRARRVLRWVEHVLAGVGAAVLLCATTPAPMWLYDAMDRQDRLAPAKYVICLGGDNARVIEAARLLREGHAERLIVSNYGMAAAQMRDLAYEWGAPYSKILVDDGSRRTADHPGSIQRRCGVDPARDVCILVTSYSHMARSKACFAKAGYQRLILREPRWERPAYFDGYRTGFWVMPRLVYECAAWVEYWVRGYV
jgi:uncharacterized SAM-binding protein YcdF (DUF218 family)